MQLGEKSATVARLIKSGKARGPVVESFQRIQQTQGDDAAFEYLRVEADGFHSTPYGHCVNSFLVDPCAKHLECFTGCRHLSATDMPEIRQNLVQLEAKLTVAVETLEKRKELLVGGSLTLGPGTEHEGELKIEPVAARAVQRRLTSGIGVQNQLDHAKVRRDGVRKLLATHLGQLVFPEGPDLSAPPNAVETVLDDIL